MLQFQNLAGQSLAQREDGTTAELGKIHILAHFLAHFIIAINLPCVGKADFPIVVLHLAVGHHRAVTVYLKVAFIRIHNHIIVLVRAKHLGNDATEALLQDAHQCGTVYVLCLLKFCKRINQTDGFCFFCHGSI